MWSALVAIGLAAIMVTGIAVWQGRTARGETRALDLRDEQATRDREQGDAVARALAMPPADAVIASLRAHLPPGVRLAAASRGEDGSLQLAIDTPDPDALRAAIAADAWLAPFRERGQDARDDGTIRVRLTGRMR